MKSMFGAVAMVLFTIGAAEQVNPLSMVFSLLDELTAKLQAEGEAEDKAYAEYFEWCDDTSKNGEFEIKTLTSKQEKLDAKIEKLTDHIEDNDEKIGELVASIEKDTKDLDDATVIRKKERADFEVEEAELVEGIDTLSRAIGIIDRESSKNPAALAQLDGKLDTNSLSGALKALAAVFDAASFSINDQKKLAVLVQTARQNSNDDDTGAPAPSVYKSHSGGILDTLEDMKEKAEEELSTLRKEEMNTKNNYEMLKQSLEDSISADTKDKEDEQALKAKHEEEKSTAEGDLSVTKKALAQAKEEYATVQQTCMQTAADHEVSTAGRKEELKVIAEARKILQETTSGAEGQTYSLVQVHASIRLTTRRDLESKEVVNMIAKLAKTHHSAALSQLASRVSTVLRYGLEGGDDPFKKIKGLISDMIAKLTKEAEEDAKEKAYCDDQMSKTEAKKQELDDDIAKLTSKIDKASADSTTLKEEVKVLQEELAKLAKEQKEMDRIRAEQHEAFVQAKEELELGLKGVRAALEKLREYYGGASASASMLQSEISMKQPAMPEMHGKAEGAGMGIMSILEVCESDFAKELAAEEKQEEDSQSEYETITQENKIAKTTKNQDVKYKTQEFIGLDKAIADLSSDKETANTELSAVMEYYGKIKERCVAKPETYEEIVKRRTAEIAGLKEALSILEGEAAFTQGRKRGALRGHLLG